MTPFSFLTSSMGSNGTNCIHSKIVFSSSRLMGTSRSIVRLENKVCESIAASFKSITSD